MISVLSQAFDVDTYDPEEAAKFSAYLDIQEEEDEFLLPIEKDIEYFLQNT